MKDTNTLDIANKTTTRNGTPDRNGVILPPNKREPKRIVEPEDDEDAEHAELKQRFITKLTEYQRAQKSLVDVVREMIDAEVERDEAIEWAVEAGFSESYARATVSTLYSALIGRERKEGHGGRKGNDDAKAFGDKVLKQFNGNHAKAMTFLLAARRHVEKLAKEAKKPVRRSTPAKA